MSRLTCALIVVCAVLAVVAQSVSGCQTATALIESAEGYRSKAYVDTTGHKTICYGFNLDVSGAAAKIAAVGANFNAVYNDEASLSQSQCATLLSGAVSSATGSAQSIFGNQGACINAVLTDMTYNLGAGGMATFTTFISLIKSHQWQAAANDLISTTWCGQVGTRCSRDRAIIAAGPQGSGVAATTPAHTTTRAQTVRPQTTRPQPTRPQPTGAHTTGGSTTGSTTGGSTTGGSTTGGSTTGASSTGAPTTGASSTGAQSTGASSTGAQSTGFASTVQTAGSSAGYATSDPSAGNDDQASNGGGSDDQASNGGGSDDGGAAGGGGSDDGGDFNSAESSIGSSSSSTSNSVAIGVGVGVGAACLIAVVAAVMIVKRRRVSIHNADLNEKLVDEAQA